LRDRDEDIIQLAQHFLEQTCTDFGREPMNLTRTQADNLRRYDWPGNIRELKNVIERAVILSTGKVLRLDVSMPVLKNDITETVHAESSVEKVLTDREMREFQKRNTLTALTQSNWRVSGEGGAADILGVKPTTLADRIRTFGIKRPPRP
jgi:DNA-binding NtrC family response regulator